THCQQPARLGDGCLHGFQQFSDYGDPAPPTSAGTVAMRMAAMTDGTVTLSIDPENVDDDGSLGVVGAIEGAFECVATGSAGATCIQSGVENMVRAAFDGLTKAPP